MDEQLSRMSRDTLLARALQEDQAAIRAKSAEACLAHHRLAAMMREEADELLDAEPA